MKLIKLAFLFCFLTNISNATELKNKINNFFASFNTMQAEFVQYDNYDNTKLTKGLFYIDRPGKLRFEYHSPFKSLLINNKKIAYYYDVDLDELTTIPSSKTPLSFLLQKSNSIEEMNFIIENIEKKDGKVFLKVKNKEIDEVQHITFIFNSEITTLISIIIQDGNGNNLTIELFNVKLNQKINKNLFILRKK